ncbi:hypothetical protein [Clostridium thermobutyricum]|uniref:hypothetical protein n=1 Tax=Clostridium thermobutyricum TaxID=29372 RepID=UPI0029421239|nr:hypothetical protein [Clostridium thermobutyricum]
MKNPLVLRKFALDMIKRNNLSKAKLALSKSLAINSELHDTYTLIGDIYFLENKKEAALNYYKASMHLLVLSSINVSSNEIIDNKFYSLSKDVQNLLPSKYAQYLLNESTISYHVGHALLNNLNFIEYEKVYREALITKLTLETILYRHNLSSEPYLEYRNSTLIPLGRNYLIKNINWDLIFSNNVHDIYINKDLSKLSI